jgi:hypothetical protein
MGSIQISTVLAQITLFCFCRIFCAATTPAATTRTTKWAAYKFRQFWHKIHYFASAEFSVQQQHQQQQQEQQNGQHTNFDSFGTKYTILLLPNFSGKKKLSNVENSIRQPDLNPRPVHQSNRNCEHSKQNNKTKFYIIFHDI